MQKHLLGTALLSAGLLGSSAMRLDAETPAGPGQQLNGPASQWSFDIVPYLWLATYDGTFDLPGAPAGIPRTRSTSTDPFSTHISAAAMLTARVRYRAVGLFLDGAWLQLKTEGDTASSFYSGTDIRNDIAFGTMALTYRLSPVGKLRTELLAGARVWYASTELEFKPGTEPGYTTDDSHTWTDPIVGASLRYDFSKHWYGIILGDVGGFGVGSDLSWNVYGGVGYRFTSWCSATLGYRCLHVGYKSGGFVMDANVQGFLLGIGFHF